MSQPYCRMPCTKRLSVLFVQARHPTIAIHSRSGIAYPSSPIPHIIDGGAGIAESVFRANDAEGLCASPSLTKVGPWAFRTPTYDTVLGAPGDADYS